MWSTRVFPLVLLFIVAGLAAPSAHAFLFKRDYRTERVIYARPEGTALRMTLYLPRAESETPRPAVALFHGGAWLIGTRQQVGWYARRLAEHGYVAATVSYRKLPKHGFPACVYDAKAAVRWLRVHAVELNIDPERIAASGHSAGGHLAMMLGTTGYGKQFEGEIPSNVSAEVAAVISVYGAVDLTVYQQDTEEGRLEGISRKLLDAFLEGVEDKNKEPYVVASPVTYIDEHSAPTLFIQGDEDWLVPPSVSEKGEAMLRAVGVPTRRVVVEGVGHSFDQFAPKRRPAVLKEMLRFLEEHMGKASGADHVALAF